MSERTFAGNTKSALIAMPQVGEFMSIGKDLFEGEKLIDLIYKAFIPLIVKSWIGGKGDSNFSVEDIGHLYTRGIYLACCERTVLSGQVDLINDALPDYASTMLEEKEGDIFFATVRKVRLPRGIVLPAPATGYVSVFFDRATPSRQLKRMKFESSLEGRMLGYFGIKADGVAIPAVRLHGLNEGRTADVLGSMVKTSVSILNLESDAKHLWTIRTSENVVGTQQTPLRLGVKDSHVKSLFYARTLPVTETGRRRPILHWVQAHQRRLKEGIEIDVTRHLRGIEAFEMDGFGFEITNPRKRPACPTSS